jgi:hypothetical protein
MSILDKNKQIMSKKERDVIFNFDKWYNRSIVKYNDSSFFLEQGHIQLVIGLQLLYF